MLIVLRFDALQTCRAWVQLRREGHSSWIGQQQDQTPAFAGQTWETLAEEPSRIASSGPGAG